MCKKLGIRYYAYERDEVNVSGLTFCVYDCYKDIELRNFVFENTYIGKTDTGILMFGALFSQNASNDINYAYSMYMEEYLSLSSFDNQCLEFFSSEVMYSKEAFKTYVLAFDKLYKAKRLYRIQEPRYFFNEDYYLSVYRKEEALRFKERGDQETPSKIKIGPGGFLLSGILIMLIALIVTHPIEVILAVLMVLGLVVFTIL